MSLVDDYDGLLLDLDGTVWEGGQAIPGAVDVINSCGLPSIYITNNASRSSAEVSEMLRAIGLEAQERQVVTSAQAAAKLAAQQFAAGTKALVVGAQAFRDVVSQAGFQLVDSADDSPEVVFQGFDPEINWAALTECALAVRAGAKYFASNRDTTLPIKRGLAVGNGSLIAAVVSATGIEPVSSGKPGPEMFYQGAKLIDSEKALVVGDRLDTDIAGGVAAAMDTFHVLTGVSGPIALLEAPIDQRPTFIGENMADLAKEASELIPGAQGGFTARFDGEDILLEKGDEGATSIQALRTVLEVAWALKEPPRYIQPRSLVAEKAIEGWA